MATGIDQPDAMVANVSNEDSFADVWDVIFANVHGRKSHSGNMGVFKYLNRLDILLSPQFKTVCHGCVPRVRSERGSLGAVRSLVERWVLR